MPHTFRDRARLVLYDFRHGLRSLEAALDEIEDAFWKGVTPQPPATGDQLARPASPGWGVG